MPGTTNAIESTAMHDNLPVSFDAIERQLQAYNTHDANAFAASFTER